MPWDTENSLHLAWHKSKLSRLAPIPPAILKVEGAIISISPETHQWGHRPPAGMLCPLSSNFLHTQGTWHSKTVLRSTEVQVLAAFSNMSFLSPLSHLESRRKMTAPKLPGILWGRKTGTSDLMCFFVSLFSMLRFSLVTKHKVCALCCFHSTETGKYLSAGMFTTHTIQHTALQIMMEVKKLKIQNIYPLASMMVNEMFSPMHTAMAWIS